MKIVKSGGKTFNADWTLHTTTRHGAKQVIIQLPGTTDPGDIVESLVGSELIQEYKNDVCTPYEGYTLLSSIIYTPDRSAVRVTLEKGGTA